MYIRLRSGYGLFEKMKQHRDKKVRTVIAPDRYAVESGRDLLAYSTQETMNSTEVKEEDQLSLQQLNDLDDPDPDEAHEFFLNMVLYTHISDVNRQEHTSQDAEPSVTSSDKKVMKQGMTAVTAELKPRRRSEPRSTPPRSTPAFIDEEASVDWSIEVTTAPEPRQYVQQEQSLDAQVKQGKMTEVSPKFTWIPSISSSLPSILPLCLNSTKAKALQRSVPPRSSLLSHAQRTKDILCANNMVARVISPQRPQLELGQRPHIILWRKIVLTYP